MSTAQSPGRALLLGFVDVPELISDLPDDADLVVAGLNSGDIIRLALAIEERTGQALDDDDLAELSTVAGIDRILAERGGAGGTPGATGEGAVCG